MDNILDGILDNMWDDIFEEPEYYGWTPNIFCDVAKDRLIKYLKKYGPHYDKANLDFIKTYFLTYLGRRSPDVRLAQIYSYIGAYPDNVDPYIGYLDVLKKYFNIEQDILDIASGDFPAFGLHLAREQLKLNNGSVTLYDPNMVLEKPLTSNMILHKENFTLLTDISKYNLVTSILPCSVTEVFLERVLREDKEFLIALCSCLSHGIHGEKIRSHEEIIYDVNERINKMGNGKLKVEYLDSRYKNNLPILIYKKNI